MGGSGGVRGQGALSLRSDSRLLIDLFLLFVGLNIVKINVAAARWTEEPMWQKATESPPYSALMPPGGLAAHRLTSPEPAARSVALKSPWSPPDPYGSPLVPLAGYMSFWPI